MQLSRIVYIKDLLILQSPIVFDLIKNDVNKALNNGVYIGELAINPYIFETRSLDVVYLKSYIKALSNLSKLFKDIFDEYLFYLRNQNIANLEENFHNINNEFHLIFNQINNLFNKFMTFSYIFEDFELYMSDTSVDVITSLYNKFNDEFKLKICGYTGINVSIYINKYSMKYLNSIYDEIFEAFEPIYLPFY